MLVSLGLARYIESLNQLPPEDSVVIVAIDEAKCQGHARCAVLAPEIFGTDELGQGVVVTPVVMADQEAATRLAAANCPERAIRIDE
jgi:ferredoxin